MTPVAVYASGYHETNPRLVIPAQAGIQLRDQKTFQCPFTLDSRLRGKRVPK